MLRLSMAIAAVLSVLLLSAPGSSTVTSRDSGDLLTAEAGGSPAPGEASYRDQLTRMLDLLYRTSNINVIRGLNLSADQLERLQRLAVEVEKQVPPFSCKGALSPDVAAVDRAYSSLAESLLKDGNVSEDLKKEVFAARAREAAMIKESLAYDRSMPYGDCLRCHVPEARRKSAGSWQGALMSEPEEIKKEQGYSHFSACMGSRGIAVYLGKSGEVDAILSDNQKLLVDEFSCCLIPPEDLSSPVRIGQVDVSVNDVKLLDAVRCVSEESWPDVRARITEKLAYLQFLRSPDITAGEKEQLKARAAAAMDRARSLSAEDYALEKEAIASQMKGQKKSPNQSAEKTRLFKQAFFLLMPGSRDVYERVMKSTPR